MKRVIVAGLLFLVAGPGQALATNCVGSANYSQLTRTEVRTLLGTGMACSPPSGTASSFESQEYHTGSTSADSGSIQDYKMGPAAAGNTDPTTSTSYGSYSIASSGAITYSYPSGGSKTYTYTIWGNPASDATSGLTWDYCSGSSPIQVKVLRAKGAPVSCTAAS